MSFASAIMNCRSAIASELLKKLHRDRRQRLGKSVRHASTVKRLPSVLALAMVAFITSVAEAQGNGAGTVQLYSIAQPDWPLLSLPSRKAAKRGALMPYASFPVFTTLEAQDCKNRWWQVGPSAWLCPDEATATPVTPTATSSDALSEQLLYVAVGKNGALGYRRREEVDLGSPAAELQPGFMLGIAQTVDSSDGSELLTTHGYWISSRDVQVVRPSTFHGSAVDGELEIGWVFDKRAPVYSAPDKKAQPPTFVERLTQVTINGQQQKPSGLWLKTEQGWLKAADVRVPELQPAPSETSADERWIDVDTKTQTLVAYAGRRPVFATLVSTGRGKTGTEQATPTGLHRLWVKLRRSDMDNLDDAESQSPYAVEAVPYVMFFDRGYGIHGTYWHDRFGTPKSHGCVNVSLDDARWLFEFTGPHLPRGWSAVFPNEAERGTLVQVR